MCGLPPKRNLSEKKRAVGRRPPKERQPEELRGSENRDRVAAHASSSMTQGPIDALRLPLRLFECAACDDFADTPDSRNARAGSARPRCVWQCCVLARRPQLPVCTFATRIAQGLTLQTCLGQQRCTESTIFVGISLRLEGSDSDPRCRFSNRDVSVCWPVMSSQQHMHTACQPGRPAHTLEVHLLQKRALRPLTHV